MARGEPCETCGEWVDRGLENAHECPAEILLPIVRQDVERWRSAYLESQALRYGETERLETAEHKLAQIRQILENYDPYKTDYAFHVVRAIEELKP